MIYLDNAATSFPKPPEVQAATRRALEQAWGNPGRAGHGSSLQAGRIVQRTREKLARLFGSEDPEQVIFTANATQAINQVLFGLLKSDDHVITTSIEHNAVTRPLAALSRRGVKVTEIPVPLEGQVDVERFAKSFTPSTRLLVTTHASNVTGTLLPVRDLGALAAAHGVLYLVDAAQTAGVFDLDMTRDQISFLTFPGHKGLLGPQGTGGLLIRGEVLLDPLIYGGTGSVSEKDEQPDYYPDRLESGTLNTIGIAGLDAALTYLEAKTLKEIRSREQALCQRLIDGLLTIPGVRVYGGTNASEKAPIVAFNLRDLDSLQVAFILDNSFGIQTRAGLHCAPHAHRTLGTLEQGVVRLSPSHFTREEDIDTTLDVIRQIALEL